MGHTPSLRLVDRPDAPRQAEQLPFPPPPPADVPRTIEARFARYHAAHPEVYAELVKMARLALDNGERFSMKGLFEVLRWKRVIEGRDAGFKLNNVFTSRYSRLIHKQEPDLDGFFDTRELKSA